MKIKAKELKQTCAACPSQWEGRTEDDKSIYIRYRWGYLSVCIGQKGGGIGSAVNSKEVFGKQLGDDLDGSLSEEEMRAAAHIIIIEPESEAKK